MNQASAPRLAFKMVAITALSIVIGEAVGGAHEQVPEKPPSVAVRAPSSYGNSVELLTPTEVDFSQYISKMSGQLKKNWYAAMPQAAYEGEKGKAIVRFQIQPDGKVENILLEVSSGKDSLDQAAIKGIRDSNPLDPLPSTFKGPYIALRFIFLYNMATNDAQAASPFDCNAPTTEKPHAPPFDRLELLAFLAAQSYSPYGARAICERGIDFSPDSSFLDSLRFYGVSTDLVGGLTKLKPQTIRQSSPGRVSAYGLLDLALADKRKRQLASADEDYEHALQLASDSATLHLAYAMNLLLTQKFSEAEVQSRRSLELWPEDAEAHLALAWALSNQKCDSEAAPEAREALRIFPSHKAALIELGFSLARSGQYKESIAVLREVMPRATEVPLIHQYLAGSLVHIGVFDAAIEQLNLFLKTNPNDAEAHYFGGAALRGKGKRDEVLVQFREAARQEPNNPVYSVSLDSADSSEPEAAVSKPAGPRSDDCFFSGSTYTNTFFGFSYEFPRGWIVQKADTGKATARLGVSILSNGDPIAPDMAEAAASKAYQLLYVTKQTTDISTSVSSIHITALDKRFGPDLKSGEDFLKPLIALLGQRGLTASVVAPPEQFEISGRTFWKLRLDFPVKNVIAHLAEVVTI